MRELSVIGKFVDAKINRLVVGLISEAFRNECADHRDHLVDVALVGRARKFVGMFDPQGFGVFEERLFELLGEFYERTASLARAANRLVIHIGDVHHPKHLVTAKLKMQLKQIFKDIGAKISNVRPAVNSRATSVDLDGARSRIEWLEFFEFTRVGIEKTHLSCRAKARCLSINTKRFLDSAEFTLSERSVSNGLRSE